VVRGILVSPALPGPVGESLVDDTAVVDPSARVVGGSAIGPGVTVQAGAQVDGSVIGEGVHIGMDSTLLRCLVGSGAQIGPGVTMTDATIGDGARIGAHNELAAGIRIWCDAVIPHAAIRFSPLP
jgi:mannose-1-phosphate guanylyltransferase